MPSFFLGKLPRWIHVQSYTKAGRNPNRTVHSAGFLKALPTSSASSGCISTNAITKVFMLKLQCNYTFRTGLIVLSSKEQHSQGMF